MYGGWVDVHEFQQQWWALGHGGIGNERIASERIASHCLTLVSAGMLWCTTATNCALVLSVEVAHPVVCHHSTHDMLSYLDAQLFNFTLLLIQLFCLCTAQHTKGDCGAM